jgi:hypothetical protein
VQSSAGDWECLQYHDDELMSQNNYFKQPSCPICGNKCFDVPDEADLDWTPRKVIVGCRCPKCKAIWNEIYIFDCYEMVGTK